MSNKQILQSIRSNSLKGALFLALFLGLACAPASAITSGGGPNSLTNDEKILQLCAQKLNISVTSNDPTLAACDTGYTLGINDKTISGCDKYKDAKAFNACKTLGYGLGKSDPLNIKPQAAPANPPSGTVTAQLSGISAGSLPKTTADNDTVDTIMQVAFGMIGAFALLSITASGLKYITSAGDTQRTSEAKKGIAYSLVGLAIAISAEAIVTFVVSRAS